MNRSKLEIELRCGVCKTYFHNPIMFPCGHSTCYECAKAHLQPVTDTGSISNLNSNSSQQFCPEFSSSSSYPLCSGSVTSPLVSPAQTDDSDMMSTVSETDSGVVLSRPTSYVSSSSIGSLLSTTFSSSAAQSSSSSASSTVGTLKSINQAKCENSVSLVYGNAFQLVCSVCKRIVYLNEKGVDCLPENKALENLLQKVLITSQSEVAPSACDSLAAASSASSSLPVQCQLCDSSAPPAAATKCCEVCEAFYCTPCLKQCHPMRGPLAKHTLHDVAQGRDILLAKLSRKKDVPCAQHCGELVDLFCIKCQSPICSQCLHTSHPNHEVALLTAHCKTVKNELSKSLQALSGQAKCGTEFMQHMKSSFDKISENCSNLERQVNTEIDHLISLLEEKRVSLLKQVDAEKEHKTSVLKEQMGRCVSVLSRTTSLLQFCVEILKEPNAATFLQTSKFLLERVHRHEHTFPQQMDHMKPRVRRDFEMRLTVENVQRAIDCLAFEEHRVPDRPKMHPENGIVSGNSVTVRWSYHGTVPAQSYQLEIDDGNGGAYRIAYQGPETVCTVENLHFNSLYKLRVRAANQAGTGSPSEVLTMKTSTNCIFRFLNSPFDCHSSMVASDGVTITSTLPEDQVVLGSTCFSRGVHYWSFRVEKFDPSGQLAFGVATTNCGLRQLLGSDCHGWSMYINCKRSWFLHNGSHFERLDVQQAGRGTVVGVRLDCDKGHLSYYLNNEPHGPIAFTDLLHSQTNSGDLSTASTGKSSAAQWFYPALSLSHNQQVVLLVNQPAPSESESSSSEEEEEHQQAQLGRGVAANFVQRNPSSSGHAPPPPQNVLTHGRVLLSSTSSTPSSGSVTAASTPLFRQKRLVGGEL